MDDAVINEGRGEYPTTLRWTRERYHQAIDAELFGPEERIELLDGEIIQMASQKTPHAVAVSLADEALRAVFGVGFVVRCQLPVALDDASEPEPDIAVVEGVPRDFLGDHPLRAVLLVEVSETTLTFDRGRKLAAYARNGQPEYWIVNLVDRRLEVYREPDTAAADYTVKKILGPGQVVAPLGTPGKTVAVDDLLP